MSRFTGFVLKKVYKEWGHIQFTGIKELKSDAGLKSIFTHRIYISGSLLYPLMDVSKS